MGELRLATIAGARDGRVGASFGTTVDFLAAFFGCGAGLTGVSLGAGRKETVIKSCGLIRFWGFGQSKIKSTWITREIAKKRAMGELK